MIAEMLKANCHELASTTVDGTRAERDVHDVGTESAGSLRTKVMRKASCHELASTTVDGTRAERHVHEVGTESTGSPHTRVPPCSPTGMRCSRASCVDDMAPALR